ncbi:cyclin-dependent protein kinase inhibitor SMR6-like [Juglans microcarpa x Juglans regia]|uniref:cyclin-dependent protein kinase inhibitor SMR6-like n=1 Tax=Juglans microcarpa x Juglans regia TaxID=2249226 RepID=UPI001B7EAE6D|nr:cyclin-dependent protein kinase inhibitor SMR6-like [Juglans microcarpa x Juglans regia]
MGFSGKALQLQADGGLESDGKKWVIAGIPLRAPLKPIYTNPVEAWAGSDGSEECSTTPTGEEARIPTRLTCPPAPRKRKPSLKCNYGGVREFFTPPDLESVFIQRAS